MSLGKRLKIERIRKGVTTREVSKKFNLGKSTISNYENDYRKPDAEMIRKLAEYYGVTADYLLGLTEHRNVKVLKEDSLPYTLRNEGVEEIGILDKYAKDKNVDPEMVKKIIDALSKE